MNNELFDHLEAMDARADIRVIVITGEGRGFCAGADLGGLDATAKAGSDGDKKKKTKKEKSSAVMDARPFDLIKTLNTPVIAAINGPVAGIG